MEDLEQKPPVKSRLVTLIKYTIGGVLGLFGLIVVIAAVTAFKEKSAEKNPPVVKAEKQETKAEPAYVPPAVTAKQIYADFDSNEVAAGQKYGGKFFDITGSIDSIGKDILGDPYILFQSGKEYWLFGVQAMFSKSQSERLAQLSKGEQVTIRCEVGASKVINVPAKNCIFISQ